MHYYDPELKIGYQPFYIKSTETKNNFMQSTRSTIRFGKAKYYVHHYEKLSSISR